MRHQRPASYRSYSSVADSSNSGQMTDLGMSKGIAKFPLFCLAVLTSGVCFVDYATAQTDSNSRVNPPPSAVRDDFDLDPFYTKCLMVGGMPIIGSDRVNDAAILEAAYLVRKMLDVAQPHEIECHGRFGTHNGYS